MPEQELSSSGPARGVNRRSLLRAAGLGTGVLAAGGLAAGRADAAGPAGRAATAAVPAHVADGSSAAASTDLPLVGGPDFPIGLFWPPHPYETTLARYQEITEAGFTFLITGNYLFDARSASYALGMADQVGLKVLVAGDPRIEAIAQHMTVTDDRTVPSSITTADATSWVSAALASYPDHPSLAGLSVYDEPSRERFPTVGALTGIVRATAPALLPYANINRGNGATYADFVQAYVDAVRPALISFDRYPILTDGVDVNYFDTWAIVRAASLKAGVPAWTYIQSTGYNGHRVPTASQLAWQVNISLAYGCKGIQYFTYWTPDPARGEGYTQALITVDGKRTPLYDAAKALNAGWLRPVGRELKPLVSESVQHANDTPLPPGTTAFAPGPYVATATGDAVVLALFRAGAGATDDGTRHLLVVNRDPDGAASVRIGVNPAQVKGVARFTPSSATYTDTGAAGPLTVDLEAGAAALYRLSPS
ncbi:hypothetical protein SAMN05216223_105392 [Actinacidiphila yanglinensis]|uniref:Beta-galactosidase n=1 Tax=Actinacidiphila yanglinensis TaxID=310779 RepID=A0A1H6AH55_9ACTN|nr:hypothetical protein [Actinacidiphila yanglinensis]SEG47722.1 hypothetical protein SAMN05216223_105392 [Actinacidiphila yanglinensis]